jgi:hypothetical protein
LTRKAKNVGITGVTARLFNEARLKKSKSEITNPALEDYIKSKKVSA